MDRRFHVQWLLLPATALAAAPAVATTYFTVEQAQQAMLPGQALAPLAITLTPAQAKAVEQASGVRVRERALKVWRAANGGWFYLDQVLGKHEFITYALALDAHGAVTGLEILDYRETYGGAVRNPKWRAQFSGKRHGAPLKLDADIANLSGATLSSAHIADGVRRLLATHALVVAPAR
ncbi:MAG TPA: FMN-binding protein [Xanthomonadaceae bacterium]|nr:FMN-binding protein [Xanthomonadaceae bacterium]